MNGIVCDSCGVTNAAGTEFCTGCGTFLDWEGADSGPSTRPITPAAAPPPPPPAHLGTPPPGPSAPSAQPGRPPGPASSPAPESAPARERRTTAPPPSAEVGYRLIVPQGAPPPPGLGGPADGGPLGGNATGRAADGAAATAVLQAEPISAGLCPDCGRENPPELRFCAKCGHRFPDRPTEDVATQAETARLPWWRRWLPHRKLGTASARRSFRRSLPMRYRMRRYIVSGVVLALVVGLLLVSGRNPIGWVSDRIADLKGTLVPVTGLTATGEPQDSVLADHPPGYAIDNFSDTAWGTAWPSNPATPVAPGDCVAIASVPAAGAPGSLLLTLPSAKKIRAIDIAAGLPADDPLRSHQWIPTALELSFSDGTCQQVPLTNSAEVQRVTITPVTTSQVRMQVVDAQAPPPDQPINVVALSVVRLLARP